MDMMSDKQKLEKLEKEFEEFLYIISHDFAAPIRHINGFVSIIQQDSKDQIDPDTNNYLNNISKSGDHLDAMLKGLLTLSRLNTRPGKKVDTSLKGLFEAVWERELRGIRPEKATLTIDDLPDYVGDEDRLLHAFHAILQNCILYRDPETDLKVEISCRCDGHMHAISIKDNGTGINIPSVERVFKPFYRAVPASAQPGLGMGLAIAKKIIEHHGGLIEIANLENGGANVTIYLPVEHLDEKLAS